MQTTARVPPVVGTAHHVVMREWKRHKGTGTEKKKCVLSAIPLFPLKKTKWQSALFVNFGIFSPPVVVSGILVIKNQKNKACIIGSGNAHRSKDTTYKYKIHVRCSCTFHIYGPFLRGVWGQSTCSRCGTVSSAIYAWSLYSPCKKGLRWKIHR